jgi:hypothetical protein
MKVQAEGMEKRGKYEKGGKEMSRTYEDMTGEIS